ncbi:major histocompatibility complex class I-related gene protein-like isoform X2 [Pituophis catenifer annectens]|uniref:major histocompatibility complex class I-related gene protein-like isoform X2 n=1 Tax=Pituophis catenifer annectens TaxID=94852 RepID=UPI003991649A
MLFLAPVGGALSLWEPTGVFGRRCGGARGRRAMPLSRAPLLLLWAGLGSFVPRSRCEMVTIKKIFSGKFGNHSWTMRWENWMLRDLDPENVDFGDHEDISEEPNLPFLCSPRHSLCYSYLKVSEPSQGLPQFLSVIHLDDQPIARYDNHINRMELLVPWLEAEEMKNLVVLEREFRADLEWLSNLSHQTAGLHTWQAILGCELREDGSKGGFLHYGYNGMDFISFDKETLRWVAAQPQAQKVKEMWEDDTRKSQRNKVYLEEMCIKMMQKCLSYQKESLKKTEPPVGKVNYKIVDDRLEVLICQAFGFYPKEIQAIWRRDGEACKYGTLQRNVAPNSDGTYYVQLSIEIDPKERDLFRCHLEHEGLQEPLVLAFKEETGGVGWIPLKIVAVVGIVPIMMCLLFLFRRCQWRRHRNNLYQGVATCGSSTDQSFSLDRLYRR